MSDNGGNGTPIEVQVGWLCYGAGSHPQLEDLDHPCKVKVRVPVYMKAIRLEDASGEGLYLDQDVSDLIAKYQSGRCFCGDPSKPDVAHRSHECLPIGPQSGRTTP